MTTVAGHTVNGVDADLDNAVSWYFDLVHVTKDDNSVIFRDLYIDVIVPTDGRHYRMLDLDEFADAIAAGILPVDVAVDALRRWQTFLERHLHSARDYQSRWTDFPPAALDELAAIPAPIGKIVEAL